MKERARPKPYRRNELGAPGTERREGERFQRRPGGPFVQGLWSLAQFGFHAESNEGPWEIFFFTFYFEKMIDSQEAAKIVQKSPVYLLSSASQW